MIPVRPRSALAIGLTLALLMAATRSHHFAATLHLPDASWAAFFLAGFYLRPVWVFPALITLAGVSDYVAIAGFGVSDFCASPAYGFLLPAYGALWLAGRWYAGRHRFALSTLIPLAGSVVIGAAVCETHLERRLLFLLRTVCGNESRRARLAVRRSISRPLW